MMNIFYGRYSSKGQSRRQWNVAGIPYGADGHDVKNGFKH
jgi:hypothetical protein